MENRSIKKDKPSIGIHTNLVRYEDNGVFYADFADEEGVWNYTVNGISLYNSDNEHQLGEGNG